MSKKSAQLVAEVIEMEDGVKRANRIVVEPIGTAWLATFYKTHFEIGTINSAQTAWVPNPDMTMTGQREDFRLWAIKNADIAGADWVPDDLRQDWNIRVANYNTDELVHTDIEKMIADLVLPNLIEYTTKLKVQYLRADFEDIVPTYTTSKGNPIQYVTDGKYDKNGNWAWGTIQTTLVFDHDGTEVYVTRNFELVSGCLKKMRITKPDFEAEIKAQIAVAEVVGA